MFEVLFHNNMICHAVEAMLFASAGCGILSILITQMKISSIGFTLAHGAFAGSAVGMFLHLPETIVAIISSVIVGAILGPLADKARMPIDTILGVLFGSLMAIAVFFSAWMVQLGQGYESPTSLLFGNVISLYREEIYELGIVMLIILVFVVIFYKEISAMIFNMKIAEIAGIKTKLVMYSVLFMIAITVSLTLPRVGGLLLYVWLVTPSAIAYQFCGTLKQMMITAPVIAVIISLGSTIAAFHFELPIAPFTAVVFSLIFLASVAFSPKRRILKISNINNS